MRKVALLFLCLFALFTLTGLMVIRTVDNKQFLTK